MLPLTSENRIAGTLVASEDWAAWARFLRRMNLSSFVAALLESGGAFATLAAQSLHVSQPLLGPWLPAARLRALADMLDDPDQSAAFATMLRDETQ